MPMQALGIAGTACCSGLAALGAPNIWRRIERFIRRKSEDDEEEPWGGAAPAPQTEGIRVDYLKKLSILDTDEHDKRFDDITSVLASILGVPIVLISLVAEDRQWFKSKCGLDAKQTSRDVSFCAWTFLTSAHKMLVVPDSWADKRFAKNPLVVGEPYIRFYSGCPLVTASGIRLGALCLIDRVPRVITPAQQQLIVNFAELATRQLEKEHLPQQQDEFMHVPNASPRFPPTYKDFEGGKLRADRMKESLSEPLLLVSMNPEDSFWPVLYANDEWYELTKLPRTKSSGTNNCLIHTKHFLQLLQPLDVIASESLPKMFGSFIQDDVCFGMTCETRTKEKVQFTCRCQPANKPLDAAAEAIQLVIDPESQSSDPQEPGNRLYFVVLSPISLNTARSSVKEVSQASSSPQQSPISSINSSSIHLLSTEERDTQQSRQQGKTMESLSCIRPAQTPFSDVRLVRMIGRGSFAQVYYGLWIGQPVAVKVARWMKNKPGEARPIFEGALAVELSHPNLVQTFKHSSVLVCKATEELGPNMQITPNDSSAISTAEALSAGIGDQFETWITQEWCDMGTLMAYVDARPPMKNSGLLEVIGICLDISSAMTYMHGRGIIHGDLTANNVLLTCKPICKKGYICKVSDFGLSRILEGDNESIQTQQLGTVTYMPPELFRTDGCKLTQKADVYAMGIMMWHVYVGCVPYKNLTAPQVIVQVAQGLGVALPDDCNPLYAKLFKQCIEREPDQRPNMEVVNDTLLEYLSMDMFKESEAPKKSQSPEKSQVEKAGKTGSSEKAEKVSQQKSAKVSQPCPAEQPAVAG